jgi:hypothetical protein
VKKCFDEKKEAKFKEKMREIMFPPVDRVFISLVINFYVAAFVRREREREHRNAALRKRKKKKEEKKVKFIRLSTTCVHDEALFYSRTNLLTNFSISKNFESQIKISSICQILEIAQQKKIPRLISSLSSSLQSSSIGNPMIMH